MLRPRWACGASKRVVAAVLIGVVVMVVLLSFLQSPASVKIGKYQDFQPISSGKFSGQGQPTDSDSDKDSAASGEHRKPHLRYFKRVDGGEIFLYSAIANYREPADGELNIIISGFDSTGTDSLQCCVLVKGGKLGSTRSTVFYRFYNEPSFIGPYVQSFFRKVHTKAKQYACVLPEIGFQATHVTLTSHPQCPEVMEDYLPVVYPKTVPGGLAICGKAAFGDELDPNKLMEWFEVQRLLGVDHIQIMDAGNPDKVRKVFQYYTDLGLLNLLPYELPGVPYERGLDKGRFLKQQGDHDKSFPMLDCTQRLKGFTYVLGIDMDEVLVPAAHVSIKDFAKKHFMANPDAAGFFFYTQFYIYDWGPSYNGSDLTMFRYINSTAPRDECRKYIYLTKRIFQARTHDFTPKSSYSQYWIPEEEATLHHYRRCPNGWKTCSPDKVKDASLHRFLGLLEHRVEEARQATGIRP